MKYIILLVLFGCGDNYPYDLPEAEEMTPIFQACEPGVACETGLCKDLDEEGTASVCTMECLSHADCQDLDPNAFCICDYSPDGVCWVNVPGHEDTARHCLLPCNPLDEGACEEQGLGCEVVSISLDPPQVRFACRPPYE